jgi:hypothetical protein
MGIEGSYDISNLTPEKVLISTTYGTSSVGTLPAGTPALEWSAESPDWMTWYAAEAHCAALVDGGHDDWRLPTYTELVGVSPGGDTGTSGFDIYIYWSGTSFIMYDGAAYYVSMEDATTGNVDKGGPNYAVRCVR